MDYMQIFGENIAENDAAFAREFENFVNGRISSPNKTGKALTTMHRYLQQQAFKVFLGFTRQLALNYADGRYDERNEWASKIAYQMYTQLAEDETVYDPKYLSLIKK